MDVALLLLLSMPLILASLGEAVGQRSGVLNIGAEGMMLLGAFFGLVVADRSQSLVLGFCAAITLAIVVALISGFFTVKLGADQVVVGTAINLLALGVTGVGFRRFYGQSGMLISTKRLPNVLGLDPVCILGLCLIPTVWWILTYTKWGLAVRGCGEYPKAVEAAGFSVSKIRLSALAVGGALTGLAGAYLSLGVAGTFAEGMTAGRGFLAIALVTFGRWQPVWIALAAVFLGYTQSLQYSLQGRNFSFAAAMNLLLIVGIVGFVAGLVWKKQNWLSIVGAGVMAIALCSRLTWLPPTFRIPSQLWLTLPYVLALLVLVLVGSGTLTPRALGKPYEKEA
jgi:general nucleoside transport system permease protein